MRRVIGVAAALGIAAFLVLGIVPTASAVGVGVAIGGVGYSADDSDVAAGATVEGFTGAVVPTLVIPNEVTIDGVVYTVTTIAPWAFRQKAITSLTLPSGLLSIGRQAFDHDSLTSVTIPDSVTSMGYAAFQSNALTSVVIGNGLAVIPAAGFQFNAISSLTIGAGVTTIQAQAFLGNQLTTLTVGGNVTFLGSYAFGSNLIASLTLSPPLQTIDDSAFNSNDLTSLTLPATVTSIGAASFAGNAGIASVTFLGPAPTTFSDPDNGQSLGLPDALVVHYLGAYGAPLAAGGFTYPTWQGYTTTFVAAVDFDLRGHGDAVDPQTVQPGDLPTRPAPPTAAPWVFKGWYTDAALTQPADFNAVLSSNQTFFARWSPALASTGGTINYIALWAGIVLALVGAFLVWWGRRRRGSRG